MDGRTAIAYPPFVFSEASLTIARRSGYEATYAPDGRPCAGALPSVRFRLP